MDVHRFYVYICYFLIIISLNEAGPGFDLKGKVRADNFVQKKGKTHIGGPGTSSPIISLPMADPIELPLTKKKNYQK